jgi:predicted ester cyclase
MVANLTFGEAKRNRFSAIPAEALKLCFCRLFLMSFSREKLANSK